MLMIKPILILNQSVKMSQSSKHLLQSNKVLSPNLSPSLIDSPTFSKMNHSNYHSVNNTLTKKNKIDNQLSFIEAKTFMKESQKDFKEGIPMIDLFKENVDFREYSMAKTMKNSMRAELLQCIHNEHRIQIEKLLLQISRLHDTIDTLQRQKKLQSDRLKEEYEQISFMQVSNIKHSSAEQFEILEVQLRKTKQALVFQCEISERAEKQKIKEREIFKSQIQGLRSSLKELVMKKNEEIFQIREQNENERKQLQNSALEEVQQIKEKLGKDIKKISTALLDREQKLNKLQQESVEVNQKNAELEHTLEKERLVIEEKLAQYLNEGNAKYNQLVNHVQTMFAENSQNKDDSQRLLKELYESEIKNLLKVIKIKADENTRLQVQLHTEGLEHKVLKDHYSQQNKQLHKKLQDMTMGSLQELEHLKVKMSILHENDIKQLVKLYETKLNHLTSQNETENQQVIRLRNYMHEQTHRWYQTKKKYQLKIGKQNAQILSLKNNMGLLDKDWRDRFDTQRSAMLLTSQQLIKGAEMKQTNAKFYEQQLRKVRLTMLQMQQEAEEMQRNLKQQIEGLQEQLKKQNQNSKNNEMESCEQEQQLLRIIQEKDKEIKRLNVLTYTMSHQNEVDPSPQIRKLKVEINDIKERFQCKQDMIKELESIIEKLERQIQELKVENEQLYLENQISQQTAKGEYEKISQYSFKNIKELYERRIEELEADKVDLKNKNDADQLNLAQLIRKYKILEGCLEKYIKQSKKRSDLQERIINLGMDNCLVKNKVELFVKSE